MKLRQCNGINDYNKRKILWKIILLILGIFLWIASIINQTYISDYHKAVSVRFDEPVLSKQEIDNIVEEMVSRMDNNIPEVTLWQRDDNIDITSENRNASIKLSLVTVIGDMSKVYPVPMLYGGFLSSEDDVGCVIDRATAYRLFGNTNVVGMKLNLNNREYIIRGVMKEVDSNIMMVQEETSSSMEVVGKRYSCMELCFKGTENAKMLAERFILSNGLGTPTTYIDGYINQKLSYMLIHFPIWLSALMIIFYAIRKVYSLKSSPVLVLVSLIGLFIISFLLIKMTKMHFYYPSSMIPNKWSDLDFWASKWKMITSPIIGKEGTKLYYKDIILRKRMYIVIIGVIVAVIAEVKAVKGVRHYYKTDTHARHILHN